MFKFQFRFLYCFLQKWSFADIFNAVSNCDGRESDAVKLLALEHKDETTVESALAAVARGGDKIIFLSVFVFFLEINYLVICAFICCNAKKIVRAEHGLDAAPAPKTRTSGENILRNVVLLLHTIQSTRQPISCQCVGATSSDASGGASTRTRRSTSRTRKDNAIVWKRSKSLNSVVAFE